MSSETRSKPATENSSPGIEKSIAGVEKPSPGVVRPLHFPIPSPTPRKRTIAVETLNLAEGFEIQTLQPLSFSFSRVFEAGLKS